MILDAVISGDTVREVLDYVQFNSEALLEQFRTRRRDGACAKGGSATKNPGGCCGSTKRA